MKNKEEFKRIVHSIDEEGIGYYLLDYTDSDSMPDEESKKLFENAIEAINIFTKYVTKKSQ